MKKRIWLLITIAIIGIVFLILHFQKFKTENNIKEEIFTTDKNLNIKYPDPIPMNFEPNVGQAEKDIIFISRGIGYTLFLKSNEAVLALQNDNQETNKAPILQMELIESNVEPKISGIEKIPGKSNYFIGDDQDKWLTNIENYAKVQYENIYEGIDLIYYGNQENLEFDFVVSPGANPAAIQLRFNDGTNIKKNKNGDLELEIAGKSLTLHSPNIYQEIAGIKEKVSGEYLIGENNQIGFSIDKYDLEYPIVIDPVVQYLTFFDFGKYSKIEVTQSGEIYLLGSSASVLPGSHLFGSKQNILITKFDQSKSGNAVFEFTTFMGGEATGNESAKDFVIDSFGNIILTGYTNSNDFPVKNAIKPNYDPGNYDAFVTKLNPRGDDIVFSTYLGGGSRMQVHPSKIAFPKTPNWGSSETVNITIKNTGPDLMRFWLGPLRTDFRFVFGQADSADLTLDNQGKPESFASTIQPNETRAFKLAFQPRYVNTTTFEYIHISYGVSDDEYQAISIRCDGTVVGPDTGIVRIDDKIQYSSDGKDIAWQVDTDGSGNVYIGGYTTSAKFPMVNPLPENLAGYKVWIEESGFYTKISPSGNLLYSSTIGGKETSTVYRIGVNSLEELWVHFSVESADFPVISTLLHKESTGQKSILAKLNKSGSSIDFSTFVDGGINEIDFDDQDNVYVAGRTYSKNFPLKNPIRNESSKQETFVAKFQKDGGDLTFSTLLGGSGDDGVHAIEVDNKGNIYVVGFTNSDDFPLINSLNLSDKEGDKGFITKFDPSGSIIKYSTFLNTNSNWMYRTIDIGADARENLYVISRDQQSLNPVNPYQTTVTSGNFLAIIGEGTQLRETEIGEVVEYPGLFSILTDENEVKFTKVFGKEKLEIEAEIWEVKEDTIRFLLPCGLIFSQKLFLEKFKEGVTRDTLIYEITTNKGQANETTYSDSVIWILPKLLIYDQRVVPPVAIQQQILPQYDLVADYPIDVSSFFFLGKSVDELVGLRVVNTIQRTTYSPPLTLDLKVSIPGRGEVPPFQRFDEGPGDKAIQFDVKFDSIYCVCVFQEKDEATNPPGFPAPFQIHLAGNVGNARKLINNEPEFPRGTRQDILFNHPAPRPQQLLKYYTKKSEGAETALFKFTNFSSINPNVVAVLVPPRQNSEGMPLGGAYKRAPDPKIPVSITTPTAMTEALKPTFLGSLDSLVIDFTQLPYPAPPDSLSVNTFWNNTVAAVIGKNSKSVSLPLPSENTIKSIICDMGSGHEIYNGTGNDFQIFVTSGSYQVAVSNTPFAGTFVPIPGTFSGTQLFDLAQTILSTARYVRITASPNVSVEAVGALNMFMDVYEQDIGPMVKTSLATITMQRVKAFQTDINPFLQLITQDGLLTAHNPGGFGDGTNQFLTDAALISSSFSVFGYQRFLAKGYDQRPGKEAFGKFHVRLETAGQWDPNDISVSKFDEKDTNPQKYGNFGKIRERDSFLFQAQPGQRIAMSVRSTDSRLNSLLELYDPEGFLIAANDDYKDRGRNSALSLYLPTKSFYSDSTLPNPSTYRIVVSAFDTVAGFNQSGEIKAYVRKHTGGSYELRVFTGMLEGEEIAGPAVTSCSPNGAIQGAKNVEVIINGNDFVDGASVSFSGSSISVQSVSFINSGQLKVKINISQSASIKWYDVTVTNPNGGKKTIQNFFEVRSSFGMVNLSWQAPQIGETLTAPSNLSSYISSQQSMAKKVTIKSNQNKALTKGNHISIKRQSHIQSITNDVIEEIEPNNHFNQAQIVQGDSFIWIDGKAETADIGSVEFEDYKGVDDIEDWFRFESKGDYLEIAVYGFWYDCDLFLFNKPDSTGLVAYSNTVDDTLEEYFAIDQLPPGTYYVGVSIFDTPGLNDSTYYALDLFGNFGASSTKRLKSYNVYRSRTPNARNTGTMIANVDSNTTSFQDNPPTKRKYYYQVTAVYNQGESEPSNEASVTITKVNENEIVPDNFVLYQNYPNPFNPATEIKYSIPKTNTFVKLIIYDIFGNEIKTLINEKQNTGIHTIKWNGKNNEGKKVASGLYFYRLQARSFSEVKKMILMK